MLDAKDSYWTAFKSWRGEAAPKERHLLKSALLLVDYLEKNTDPATVDCDLKLAPAGWFKALDEFGGRSFGIILFGKLCLTRYLEPLEANHEEAQVLKPLEQTITALYATPRENTQQVINDIIRYLEQWLAINPTSCKDRQAASHLCLAFYVLLKLLATSLSNLGFLHKNIASRLIDIESLAQRTENALESILKKRQQLALPSDISSLDPQAIEASAEKVASSMKGCFIVFQQKYRCIANEVRYEQDTFAELHRVLLNDCKILQSLWTLKVKNSRLQLDSKCLRSLAQTITPQSTLAGLTPEVCEIIFNYISADIKDQLLSEENVPSSDSTWLKWPFAWSSSWLFAPVHHQSTLQQCLQLCRVKLASEILQCKEDMYRLLIKITAGDAANQQILLNATEHELADLLAVNDGLQVLCDLSQVLMGRCSDVTQDMPVKAKLQKIKLRVISLFTDTMEKTEIQLLKIALNDLLQSVSTEDKHYQPKIDSKPMRFS